MEFNIQSIPFSYDFQCSFCTFYWLIHLNISTQFLLNIPKSLWILSTKNNLPSGLGNSIPFPCDHYHLHLRQTLPFHNSLRTIISFTKRIPLWSSAFLIGSQPPSVLDLDSTSLIIQPSFLQCCSQEMHSITHLSLGASGSKSPFFQPHFITCGIKDTATNRFIILHLETVWVWVWCFA